MSEYHTLKIESLNRLDLENQLKNKFNDDELNQMLKSDLINQLKKLGIDYIKKKGSKIKNKERLRCMYETRLL